MNRRETRIIERINSQMEKGGQDFWSRLLLLSVFFGWGGIQNFYLGRSAMAAVQLAVLLFCLIAGAYWLAALAALANYLLAFKYYFKLGRRRY